MIHPISKKHYFYIILKEFNFIKIFIFTKNRNIYLSCKLLLLPMRIFNKISLFLLLIKLKMTRIHYEIFMNVENFTATNKIKCLAIFYSLIFYNSEPENFYNFKTYIQQQNGKFNILVEKNCLDTFLQKIRKLEDENVDKLFDQAYNKIKNFFNVIYLNVYDNQVELPDSDGAKYEFVRSYLCGLGFLLFKYAKLSDDEMKAIVTACEKRSSYSKVSKSLMKKLTVDFYNPVQIFEQIQSILVKHHNDKTMHFFNINANLEYFLLGIFIQMRNSDGIMPICAEFPTFFYESLKERLMIKYFDLDSIKLSAPTASLNYDAFDGALVNFEPARVKSLFLAYLNLMCPELNKEIHKRIVEIHTTAYLKHSSDLFFMINRYYQYIAIKGRPVNLITIYRK